jgi:hypothetical protein
MRDLGRLKERQRFRGDAERSGGNTGWTGYGRRELPGNVEGYLWRYFKTEEIFVLKSFC